MSGRRESFGARVLDQALGDRDLAARAASRPWPRPFPCCAGWRASSSTDGPLALRPLGCSTLRLAFSQLRGRRACDLALRLAHVRRAARHRFGASGEMHMPPLAAAEIGRALDDLLARLLARGSPPARRTARPALRLLLLRRAGARPPRARPQHSTRAETLQSRAHRLITFRTCTSLAGDRSRARRASTRRRTARRWCSSCDTSTRPPVDSLGRGHAAPAAPGRAGRARSWRLRGRPCRSGSMKSCISSTRRL